MDERMKQLTPAPLPWRVLVMCLLLLAATALAGAIGLWRAGR